MKKNLLALLALAGITAAAAPAPAMAQAVFPPTEPAPMASTPSLYVGGSLGAVQARAGCIGFLAFHQSCDNNDFTWALLAGFQFNRYFGVEGEYRDLGYVTARDGNFSVSKHTTAWDAAAVGFFPVSSRLSIFGKLGGYRALLEAIHAPTIADRHHSGGTYGAGLQWDFAPRLAARLQWQRFHQVNGGTNFGTQDYDTLSGVFILRLR
jgi:opacity protein-like surface antigen